MNKWITDRPIIEDRYIRTTDICISKLKNIIDSSPQLAPIYPLVKFTMDRLHSVLTLTVNFMIRDAEIILRSAIESLIKLTFICSAESKDEQKIRLDEYWVSLAEILELKESEQAKKNLRTLPDSQKHKIAFLPIILSEEREKELREKWTKKKRQQLEQKWSFTELLNSLSKNYKGKPYPILDVLSYSYRMSSHVTHGDETGVLIIQERDSRSIEEQEKAYNGHYLRLLSDVLTLCTQVAFECIAFIEKPEELHFFVENLNQIKAIEYLEKKYKGRVFEDVAYDQYRKKSEI
ncbi:DUF5677 domain-containing protein [Dysgonomonas sp. ZJ709]|uniref:DUF5677 domain-containing protein n=1 Tax=Dysgonomonas sp. ZJ709 TaxID=2709797 RepID=UPI0013ED3CC6|nr:DUF5677 domain-containing protein [Dysgonomonas sp. ZJ709]